MQLLLFLSALLAGLTGVLSGDRAGELRQVQGGAAAISRMAEAGAEAVAPAHRAILAEIPVAGFQAVRIAPLAPAPAPYRDARSVSERRLE